MLQNNNNNHQQQAFYHQQPIPPPILYRQSVLLPPSSSEDITPERLKLKQLKQRVSSHITPRPIHQPLFNNHHQQHDLIHQSLPPPPPPPFHINEVMPQFVQYPGQHVRTYIDNNNGLSGEVVNPPPPPYINFPVNPQQPFNIHHTHHHHPFVEQQPVVEHDLIHISNPQPLTNHPHFQQQQFEQQQHVTTEDDQLKIDQQFQCTFPVDYVPNAVRQVLGKSDDIVSEKESNLLEITIAKNRPPSMDPQLFTPMKKFNAKEEDIKKGEKIILIEDESESECGCESVVSSLKLQYYSFINEPPEKPENNIYVINDDSDDDDEGEGEDIISNEHNVQQDNEQHEEEQETKQSEDEESDHLISDHHDSSIIHEPTLPTQPKSPEHIKSSLEIDQHTAKTNLYHWSFIFRHTPKEELTVSLLGKTNLDGNRNFTTSPIVHRINSNTVLTESGSKYVLSSNSFDNVRNNSENKNLVSVSFLQQFTNSLDGPFPKNWRELVEKEFKRLESSTTHPASSNNFPNDNDHQNNFDYQIGGLDESSLKEDNEPPKTISNTTRRQSNKIFEDLPVSTPPPPSQKSSLKQTSSKKRRKYDQSSDEEDEEYVEPTPSEKKKKLNSVQTSILNSFKTKQVERPILTSELKSTLLGWKKNPPISTPPKTESSTIKERDIHDFSPEEMIEPSNLNEETLQEEEENLQEENQEERRIDKFNDEDFYNEIGGLSPAYPNRDEMIEEIMAETPSKPKKPKRKGRRRSKKPISNRVEDFSMSQQQDDLDISIPHVVLPTEFAPKPKSNLAGKTKKKVSLTLLEKAWFGGLE